MYQAFLVNFAIRLARAHTDIYKYIHEPSHARERRGLNITEGSSTAQAEHSSKLAEPAGKRSGCHLG